VLDCDTKSLAAEPGHALPGWDPPAGSPEHPWSFTGAFSVQVVCKHGLRVLGNPVVMPRNLMLLWHQRLEFQT